MPFDLNDAIDDYGLSIYGAHAISLLSIALRFQNEDFALVASKAITDGPDDKKCDLVYIDEITKAAVVAQSYVAQDASRPEAKANKASDLNTAASWVLSRSINEVPVGIRSQVAELRDGITTGKITSLHFWYIHNLPESANVRSELQTVEHTAFAALRLNFADTTCNLTCREVGIGTLEEWWKALQADVGIDETIDVAVEDGYYEKGADWEAVVCSVSAIWLFELFKKHQTDLFKGNVRDYLGLRESDANINSGIRQTAKDEPQHFFVYNNGISIITRKARLSADRKTVHIEGLGIVNGAQTTGAIGNLVQAPDSSAHLTARFIAVDDKNLVENIIRYNNSQNRVEAADFRSTDDTQARLRHEFLNQYPTIQYLGGRRGSASDKIRRNAQIADSTEVAKSLAAFHVMPTLAYNRVKELWSNANYVLIFPPDITARHIAFVYGLYRAIGSYKDSLRDKPEQERTASQSDQLGLLRSTSAFFILMAGIGSSMETFVGKAVPSTYSLHFKDDDTMEQLIALWDAPIRAAVPFMRRFRDVIEDGLKNEPAVNIALQEFSSSLEAIKTSIDPSLATFRSKLRP